jgi:hypothetical protein
MSRHKLSLSEVPLAQGGIVRYWHDERGRVSAAVVATGKDVH